MSKWPSVRISWNVSPETVSMTVAPGPPAVTVTMKGRSCPAPRPVTVAVPANTALWPLTDSDVTVPVTYMALLVKAPLPGPVGCGGARARHSKSPPLPLTWNAISVVTGTGSEPPVPPSMIVCPAPAARCAARGADAADDACRTTAAVKSSATPATARRIRRADKRDQTCFIGNLLKAEQPHAFLAADRLPGILRNDHPGRTAGIMEYHPHAT